MPRISIVVPVYNGEKYLDESLRSVFAQTCEDWELLLVDDGSVDGSVAVAREYTARFPGKVRYLEHPGHANRGQFSSRILGAQHAASSLIALLDQDDVWEQSYLEEHLKVWDEVEPHNVCLSYGPSLYWFFDEPTGSKDFIQPMPPGGRKVHQAGALLESFLNTSYADTPCPSCTFIRREVLGGLRKFEKLAQGSPYEDQYLWWYTAARWPIAVHDHAWVRYRQHGESAIVKLSSSRKKVCAAETTFLRAVMDDLRTVRPEHPLLRDGRLATRIRGLRKQYVQEELRERLPGGLYNQIDLLYRTTRATLKRLLRSV